MNESHLTVTVQTDKSEYVNGENVSIKISVSQAKQPALQKLVNLSIFAPDGKKVYRAALRTNNQGIATALYRIRKTDETGHYYVEAQSEDEAIALNAFIIINKNTISY